MNDPAIFVFMALLGSIVGVLTERLRASGLVALVLPVVPGAAFWLAIRRSWHDPMVMLMVSILCFTTPLAVVYGFHARRNAPDRMLARAGLVLSLVVFVPFVMVMIGSVLNLGSVLCH